jgi:diadenosine tetraphosphatase ApaH/serine/threonine PP2A family protein phosphatase
VHADSPEVIIDRVKKYIINAGSIGQPRDGDPRASYVMYDDRSGSVRIRRIPYNIDRAQDKIIKAGLPRYLAHRLQEGR